MSRSARLQAGVQSHVAREAEYAGGDLPDDFFNAIAAEQPSTALTIVNGKIAAERVKLTAVGFLAPQDWREDEFERLGEALLAVREGLSWSIGDWLLAGENHHWGETVQRLCENYHVEPDTIYHHKSLCKSVQFWIRNPGLSPAHHRLVAKYESARQVNLLEYAAQNHLKVEEFRQWLHPDPPPPSKVVARIGKLLSQRREKIDELLSKAEIVGEAVSQISELIDEEILQLEALKKRL